MLDSTNKFFDYCIMIDGRFYNHKGEMLSTDGSIELVESYNNVISLFAPDLTEAQKRNVYLEACKELDCEWILILDSDEYITVTSNFRRDAISKLDTKNNHYIYDILSRRNPADYVIYEPRPRLWYEPWNMEYTTCHCCYGRKDGKVRRSERPTIEGIKMEHDKELRSQTHIDDWKSFVQYQLAAESQETAVM